MYLILVYNMHKKLIVKDKLKDVLAEEFSQLICLPRARRLNIDLSSLLITRAALAY